MNEKEILARFGIGKKLAYGLLIQSILVIIATICAFYSIYISFIAFGLSFALITNILSCLVCIMLLIYSFYAFNKENSENYFKIVIGLFAIQIVLAVLTCFMDVGSPIAGFLRIIELVLIIYFFVAFTKNYKGAQYAMLLIIVMQIIITIIVYMDSNWFIGFKYLIIPCTIALTYYERVLRGKYPKLNIFK